MKGMNPAAVKFAFTVRKASAALLLFLAIAIPASAVAGLCANLPCCVRALPDAGIIGGANCCTPVACATAPAQDLLQPAATASLAHADALQAVFASALPVAPSIAVTFISHAPPVTPHERLILLSALLI